MDSRPPAAENKAIEAQVDDVEELPIPKDYEKRVLNPDRLSDEVEAPRANSPAASLEDVLDELVAEPVNPDPIPSVADELSDDEVLWSKISDRQAESAAQQDPSSEDATEEPVITMPPQFGDAFSEEDELEEETGADDPPALLTAAGEQEEYPEVPASPEDGSSAPAPQASEDAPEQEPLHMASRRASLAGSNYLPIDMRDPKEGVNEINLPLGAFSDLVYGQTGFISFSVRAVPGFKDQARNWVKARKSGSDPDAQVSIPKRLLSFLKYGISYFQVALQDPKSGKGEAPTPPWRAGKDLTPIPMSQVDDDEKQSWRDVNIKAKSKAHYEVVMRAGVIGPEEEAEMSEAIVDELCMNMDDFNTSHQEIIWESGNNEDALLGNMGAHPQGTIGMVLADKELSVMAHPMDDTVRPHNVKVTRSDFKQMPLSNPLYVEDPHNPPKGLIPIGIMNAHSEDEAVIGMNNSELDKHLITVGKTGSGKSEWLKWAVHGIAKADYPLVVLDPHGQLSDEIFNSLIVNSPERIDDIVFLDLADDQYPVAMNPLDVHSMAEVDGAVNSVVEMLASPTVNLGKGGAPRALGYAQEALIALAHANLVLEDPQTKCTLLDVLNFFQDPEFRKVVIDCCQNTTIQQRYDFDTGPFELQGEKTQVEHTAAVTRAFNDLGRSSAFQAVFSSPQNKLNFAKLIGDNSIVLIKLSRFGSGQAALGSFVGSLVLPWLLSSMTTWGRNKDPLTGEISGRGCRVLIDEAATLMGAGSSVPQVLAEARKWDLGLIMAVQFLDQFDPSIIDAALVNTNSKISLVQDPNKAGPITKAIAGASNRVRPEDIASLPNFHFYGNILLPTDSGFSNSGPFSAACLPMIGDKLTDEHLRIREGVVLRSRQMVSNNLEDITQLSKQKKSNIMAALKNHLLEEQHDSDESVIREPMMADSENQFVNWMEN